MRNLKETTARRRALTGFFILAGILMTALFLPVTQRASRRLDASDNSATPGDVWGWGRNNVSQLGVDVGVNSHTVPVLNPRITGVKAVAVGGAFTLAIKTDGTVWGWGGNSAGQLGNGTTSDNRVLDPVQAVGLTDVIAIAAGDNHSLALKSDGTVWGWGTSSNGQVGNGTGDGSGAPFLVTEPAQVKGVDGNGFLTGVKAIAAGGQFSVALKEDGTVYAWGLDNFNQLGNGESSGFRNTPVQVKGVNNNGFLTGVTEIAASGGHTLALASGSVLSWGGNTSGQLGDGSNTHRDFPVQVKDVGGTGTVSGVTAIAAGGTHSLALRSGGTLVAWGDNDTGQLGNGKATGDTNAPVLVSGLSGVTSFAAGPGHNLALKSDGTVWAWGDNIHGQLGRGEGNFNESDVPVQVQGLTGTSTVVAGAGNHSLAIKPDGLSGRVTRQGGEGIVGVSVTLTGSQSVTTVTDSAGFYAFGTVRAGESYQVTPTKAGGFTFNPAQAAFSPLSGIQRANFTCVACGEDLHKISGVIEDRNQIPLSGVTVTLGGLTNQLSVQTDANGQYLFEGLPRGDYAVTPSAPNYSFEPSTRALNDLSVDQANVNFVGNVVSFNTQNIAWAWGDAREGRLGISTPLGSIATPVQVNSVVGVSAVAGGGGHSLALKKSDGTVLAWGGNTDGQLGNGNFINRASPVQVAGLSGVDEIAAGFAHGLARKSDGTVWGWGHNGRGQLGDNTFTVRTTPVQVKGPDGVGVLAGVQRIATGWNSMALKEDGTVWTWGIRAWGQLGIGDPRGGPIPTPVQVKAPNGSDPLSGVIAIATNGNHALALKSDGTVWAWGSNSNGQLGNGGSPAKCGDLGPCEPLPVQVSGLTNVKAIAAGPRHSLALKSDGTVWAWGDNSNGQLGNNSFTPSAVPVQVGGVSDVVAISANGDLLSLESSSLALKSDGTVAAWGGNSRGQLGNGSMSNSSTPVPVNSLTGVTSISAGGQHALAQVDTSNISGRITANGVGVGNVLVTLSGAPTEVTRTDGNGNYRFSNLSLHGNYKVTPSSGGFTFSPEDRTFTNLSGNQTADFIATAQAVAVDVSAASDDFSGARMDPKKWSLGTLSQAEPVFDSRVEITQTQTAQPATGLRVVSPAAATKGSLLIRPLPNADGKHFSGYVSKQAVDLAHSTSAVTWSVQVPQVASGGTETVFSVGSSSSNWYRFTLRNTDAATAGATKGGNLNSTGSITTILMLANVNGVTQPPKTVTVSGTKGVSLGITANPSTGTATWSVNNVQQNTAPFPGNNAGAAAELSAGTTSPSANPGTTVFENYQVRAANILDSAFFARQHYLDFLSREPDDAGLQFWTNEIELCGADAQCREVKRVNVSAAFFLSIEFQETGFLSYRAHKVAFGNIAGKPVPVTRDELLQDVQDLGSGVVVGSDGWVQRLEQNKRSYFDQLAASARFTSLYPQSLTPEQFVDALNANAGGALAQAERDALVNDLKAGAKTRAQVLRAATEDPDLARAETNNAFVLMQYFGYLRRNPDDPDFQGNPDPNFLGYHFWLKKLNDFNGNFVDAEMVKAFITSIEYNRRFGQ